MSSLSRKIENCLIESAWIKPESQIEDTPELYRIVNSVAPYDFLNGVYRTHFLEKEAQDRINRLHADYKDRRISYRWYIHPHSEPHASAPICIRLGFQAVFESQCFTFDFSAPK